jgi:Uma2 family endonuclease
MIAPSRHYTFEDYLSVEEMSAVRHEFLDGEIFAMAGATPEHAASSAAVVVVLGRRLEGRPYRPSAPICGSVWLRPALRPTRTRR